MAKIYYARLDEFWRKEQKYQFLEEKQHLCNIEWQEITPDAKHNWLTEGIHDEFELRYNRFLNPSEAFHYRAEEPNYVLRLIGQIITVSLETVQIVRNLATLNLTQ